jgi:hypothetical protein
MTELEVIWHKMGEIVDSIQELKDYLRLVAPPPRAKPSPSTPKFLFQELYEIYPKKMGRAQGIKKCEREIRSPEEFQALKKAIENFSKFHRTRNTEAQYLPYFSTFMNFWRDWLDPDVGSVKLSLGSGESVEAYLARTRPKVLKDEDWEQADPEKVRSILEQALAGKVPPEPVRSGDEP